MDALAQQIGGSNHMVARRAREREVDTLLETSLALVSRLELTDLLKEVARRLTGLMDCHFCAISTYDERSQTVAMLADFDASGRRLPDTESYALSRYPATRRVLEEQTTAVVNVGDPAADRDEVRELTKDGDSSLLMVPLVCNGRSIGLLELIDHAHERRYSRQDLRICRAIAGQAAVALSNARTYAAAGAATREAEGIVAAIEAAGDELAALGAAADADDVLRVTAAAACRVFAAASCVATTEDRSAGCSTGVAEAEDDTARTGDGGRWLRTCSGADVITARDASGPGELTLTLSLARPARAGEAPLLGLLAAAANGHLARLRARGES